jgi:hypothetical protein
MSPASAESNSRAATREVGSPVVAAVVRSWAPVDDPQQNERIQTLSASFSEVCASAGVHFVGVVERLLVSTVWMTQVTAGDGSHPAVEGYDALADLILAGGWADWLRAESAARGISPATG